MPELPLRGWILIGALVTFSVVILSVLYWAQFTGRAGSQRGLVIHNDRSVDTLVIVGEIEREIRAGEQEIYVIEREQFPAAIKWANVGTEDSLMATSITYREVADAEFRLSIDEQGIHPTTSYRDTPVPATPTPEVSIVIENGLDRAPVHVAIREQGRAIAPASTQIFVLDRDDFPIYIFAMQIGIDPAHDDYTGRYVRGEEFDFPEVEAAGFRVNIEPDAISAGAIRALETR